MSSKTVAPFWQVLSLGVIAGMRCMSAPAVASHILSRRNSGHLAKSSLDFMQGPRTSVVFKVLAAGELIGDKLPSAPDRTRPLGLIFRGLSGSLAGASLYKATGNNTLTGALVGSVTAIVSTYGSYLLRKRVVDKFDLYDPVIGALEDALVIGAGVGLVESAQRL